jgi:hypothetical protein
MKFLVKLHKEPGENTLTHSVLLFLDPIILLDSIVRAVIHTISTLFFDLHIGQMNLETFDVALTTHCSVISESLTPLSSSIPDSLATSQSSLL